MKYQKSAMPYLILLVFMVVGLPLTNYQLMKNQSLEIEIMKVEEKDEFQLQYICGDQELITQNIKIQ